MSDPKDLSETSAGVNADTDATANPSVKPAQTQMVRVADNKSELAKVAKAARKKGQGYLEGNGYVVTWALGHLVHFAEPDDYGPPWSDRCRAARCR